MSADKYEQNLVIRQEYAELEARYSSLLAVLRRCAGVLAMIDDIGHADCASILDEVSAALSAARPWLEDA